MEGFDYQLTEMAENKVKSNHKINENEKKIILCLTCDSLKYMANQKVYLMWSNYWDQIILNGIIPISSLVYFNSRFSLFTQFENFGNTFFF